MAKEAAASAQARRACRPAKALGGALGPGVGLSGGGSGLGGGGCSGGGGYATVGQSFGTTVKGSAASAGSGSAFGSAYGSAFGASAAEGFGPSAATEAFGASPQPSVLLGRAAAREAAAADLRRQEMASEVRRVRSSWDAPMQDADLQRRENTTVVQLAKRQAHEARFVRARVCILPVLRWLAFVFVAFSRLFLC